MAGIHFNAEWCNEARAHSQGAIAELQRSAETDAAVFIKVGEPAEVVNAAARQFRADLVVMGRGAPGLMGRLRANSYAILRESPCAVVGV